MNINLPSSTKQGWPWNKEIQDFPETMPDGSPWPKISIVTPSFNQAQYIEETIRSVLLQGYPNLEYIIIDGGSTDGSVEIIKRYEPWLTYWVSEPDYGQTYAIQKGMDITTGVLKNWLNSDDILLAGSLFSLAEAFKCHKLTKMLLCGNSKTINSISEVISEHRITKYNSQTKPVPQAPDIMQGCQASVFFTDEAWDSLGGINVRLNFTMDTDLSFRAYRQGIPFIEIEHFIAAYRKHDLTKTHDGWKESTQYKRRFYYGLLAELSKRERQIYLPRVQKLMYGFYLGSIWPSDPLLTRAQKILRAIWSYPKCLAQPYRMRRILNLLVNNQQIS